VLCTGAHLIHPIRCGEVVLDDGVNFPSSFLFGDRPLSGANSIRPPHLARFFLSRLFLCPSPRTYLSPIPCTVGDHRWVLSVPLVLKERIISTTTLGFFTDLPSAGQTLTLFPVGRSERYPFPLRTPKGFSVKSSIRCFGRRPQQLHNLLSPRRCDGVRAFHDCNSDVRLFFYWWTLPFLRSLSYDR